MSGQEPVSYTHLGAEATLWDVTNAYAQMGRSLSNSHSNDLPQEKEVQILLGTEEKTV